MTTQQKLELIVDRLLVKSQDNLCDWKKVTDYKFSLRVPALADVIITNTGNDRFVLTIIRGDIDIASLSTEKEEHSLVRLYKCVKTYHENQVNEQLGKLIDELNKLGGEKPF